MNYVPGRPSKFGKGQRVYTWNGTQRCVHCDKVTEKGECPQCTYWLDLGFDLTTGLGHCADCNKPIWLGAPATNGKNQQIHPQADSFTVFGQDTAEGLQGELVCDSCSDLRLDKDIAEGKFIYDPDTDSWFSPDLFPDKAEAVKEAEYAANHPAYQAIEATIENGAAFQCGYCGITDDISELDYSHAGVDRCRTCADKHAAATYDPPANQPTAFDEPPKP